MMFQRRPAAALLGLLAVSAVPVNARADNYTVILLAGQSNMDGHDPALTSGLPTSLQAPQTNVSYWNGYANTLSYYTNGTITSLQPGASYFGPEVSFGQTIAADNPSEHYLLVKYAVGGTSITSWAAPTATTAAGNLNTNLKASVQTAFNLLTARGDTYTVGGMLWLQGEADASATGVTTYEQNLKNLIGDIRNTYGLSAALPFVIGGIGNAGSYSSQITSEQADIAATGTNVKSFDDSDLWVGLHFNSAGQVTIGQRFAAAMDSMPSVSGLSGPAMRVWDASHTGAGSDGSGTWDNTIANAFTGGGAYGTIVSAATTAASAFGDQTITVSAANAAKLVVGQEFSSTAFPPGTTITAINTATGVVTLSSTATGAIASGTALNFAPRAWVFFGSQSGAAGIVNVTGTQAAEGITLRPAGSGTYTFNGGTITLGLGGGTQGMLVVNAGATFNSKLNLTQVQFQTAGQTIALAGGSDAFTPAGGTQFITGSTADIAASSTIKFTAGTYTHGNAGIAIGNPTAGTGGEDILAGAKINATGNYNVSGYGSSSGVATVDGGTLNLNSANLCIARSQSATAVGTGGRFIVNSGVVTAGNLFVGSTTAGTNTFARFDMIGGTVTLVSADSLYLDFALAGTGSGQTFTANLAGGTFNTGSAGGVSFNASSDRGGSTLNLTGSTLYVGSAGINRTDAAGGVGTVSMNVSGGTIGALANWSSNVAMTLTTGTAGDVTVRAADASGTSHDIALSAALTGTGGLHKTGAGTVTLSGSNTYSGNTMIDSGTLHLAAGGTLQFVVGATGHSNAISGAGALVADGTFTIDLTDAASAIGSTWTLVNVATLTESFGSSFSISGFQASANGLTWTRTISPDEIYVFSESTGQLTVIPEPTEAGLLLCAAGGLFRRRRAQRPASS